MQASSGIIGGNLHENPNTSLSFDAILWMQVHVVFSVPMAHSLQLQQSSDQHLAFARFYSTNDRVQPNSKVKDLNMLYLEWETIKVKQGAYWRVIPSYAVVEVTHTVQKVCVCLHFALWRKPVEDPKSFLLNCVLDLWPNLERIPKDAASTATAVPDKGAEAAQAAS